MEEQSHIISLSMLRDFVSEFIHNYSLFGGYMESSCCEKAEFYSINITFPDSSGFTKAEEVPTRRKDTGTII